MEDLKQIRIMKNLTQVELSKILGISLRSYKSYENDDSKKNTPKYNYILEKLKIINVIDEEHGIVSLNYIEIKCTEILKKIQC
jgi:transcriptional regulator with XRE-family HTH domain